MGGFFFLYICLMASVNSVYKTLKDVVNKDQQGFITPDTFNNFASVAQLRIYNRLFDNLKDAQRNVKAGFDRGRDKGLVKRIQEDLSVFSKTSNTITRESSGVFNKPADLSRIISIYSSGDIIMSSSSRKPMEICYDEEKIDDFGIWQPEEEDVTDMMRKVTLILNIKDRMSYRKGEHVTQS